MRPLVDAARLRVSATSAVCRSCVAEFASFTDSDETLLDHPTRFGPPRMLFGLARLFAWRSRQFEAAA